MEEFGAAIFPHNGDDWLQHFIRFYIGFHLYNIFIQVNNFLPNGCINTELTLKMF